MEKQEKKRKNIFVRFFRGLLHWINNIICFVVFCIIYIFAQLFVRCKVRGKENIDKNDKSKIFIYNHYELYGPITMFLKFPYKSRSWIIDKMMEPECVEKQMGLMVYNNYKRVPKWIKKIVLVCVKNLLVFMMKFAKGIPVSRDNARKNINTFKISTETLEKGKNVSIAPEKFYVREGVGEFQNGFELFAKYYYQKTGKCASFYPVFISYVNKEMYIGKPIVFNPQNDPNEEKIRIINEVKSSMVNLYETYEVGSKKYIKYHKKHDKNKSQSNA